MLTKRDIQNEKKVKLNSLSYPKVCTFQVNHRYEEYAEYEEYEEYLSLLYKLRYSNSAF